MRLRRHPKRLPHVHHRKSDARADEGGAAPHMTAKAEDQFPIHKKKDLRVELRAAADLAPYAPGGPETAGAHLIAQ